MKSFAFSIFSASVIAASVMVLTPSAALAQGLGRAGSISGTVTDATGAVVPGASIEIENKVTGYDHTFRTDAAGVFRVLDVPPNNYHVTITAPGFQPSVRDVPVQTSVPISLDVKLEIGVATTTTVEVHSDTGDLLESVPTSHVDVDSAQFQKLPTGSVASGLNAVVAHSAPGIVEDSNGFIHPQGDHAQTQFVFDNQPITDQQSKQFSTSMPENAIASVEVITGAPPAEYGDKTSLVVNAITKSGLGMDRPFGSFSTSYGSFGTVSENMTYGRGAGKWGEFLSANVVRSGRYLDPPEFAAIHDVGNNITLFNRNDYQPGSNDTLHLNLFFARAWFQTPNTYDQQALGQDQKERVISYNIAPGWVHILNANSTVTVNPYIRVDQMNYWPSRNAFADGPATVSQNRRLTNAGLKADYSLVARRNNFKAGVQMQHTLLNESFAFGITDPGLVADTNAPGLAPYDLSRGGRLFRFHGHSDIKGYAIYAQDNLTFGGFNIQAGLRGDFYRGITSGNAVEPRLGISYLFKPTSTVLRVSYSRFYETPYNENLLLSSTTGSGGLASNVFGAFGAQPLQPGTRNQYNAGLQQGLGKHLLMEASYFWKFTHNGFDFDTLFNSPIAFPISWRKSKIDGASARVSVIDVAGWSAYTVMGHTRARFFGPEIGGLIFNSPVSAGVFRIDHDEALEQTTNARYQPKKNGAWGSITWRYDSGQVAGSVPDAASALALAGDQQQAIGFHCGAVYATISRPVTACANGNVGASLVLIPPNGTGNDDTNPPRIAARNLFDIAVGHDNLFHTDRARYKFQLTAVNVTNVVSLYNFLSTFSGTHFVNPRSYTAELGVTW